MEPFIRVSKALFRIVKNVSIMNTFVLFALLLSLICYGMPFFLARLHFLILPSIGLLYLCMMAEDFIYQSVDMRLWQVLFLCMQAYSFFSVRFYADFIVGIFLFFVLFSFSWKISKKEQTNHIDSDKTSPAFLQLPFGFLPSLGFALVIRFFIPLPVPAIDFFAAYSLMKDQCFLTYFIIGGACIFFLFACYRQRKLYQAEKMRQPIQYGMGGGDVWVCSAWIAFLGISQFLVIFFIALWIHVVLNGIHYFFKRVEFENENK